MEWNLDDKWKKLESQAKHGKGVARLLIYGLLFRTYIGVEDIPFKRCLFIEIPDKDKEQIDSINQIQGIQFAVFKSGQEQKGFITCELMSGSCSQNAEFTVIAENILMALENCRDPKYYTQALKSRIEIWENFFKRKSSILTKKGRTRTFYRAYFY